jgi:hypothetical protein
MTASQPLFLYSALLFKGILQRIYGIPEYGTEQDIPSGLFGNIRVG